MPQISRRAFVQSVCGVALTGCEASAARLPVMNEMPDAALIRLGREFDALVALETPLRAEVSRLWELFDAHLPQRPDELRVRNADLALLDLWCGHSACGKKHSYGLQDIHMLQARLRSRGVPCTALAAYGPPLFENSQLSPNQNLSPSARARAEQIVAAWDRWEAAKQQLQDEIRVVTVENRLLAVQREMQKRIDVILPAPAKTIQGLAAKARVARAFLPTGAPTDLSYSKDTDLDLAALLSVAYAVLQMDEGRLRSAPR